MLGIKSIVTWSGMVCRSSLRGLNVGSRSIMSTQQYSVVFQVCGYPCTRLERQTQMNGQFAELYGTDIKQAVTDGNGAPSSRHITCFCKYTSFP
jgi:hypothetical protein